MTVEELQVLITANTSDLNKKIALVNKKLDSLSSHAGKSGKGLQKAFVGIKVTAAIAAINKVTSAVKKLTDAYAETESAQMGLSSILTAQGKDLNAAKSWLKDYVADGLIPLTDAYTTYKSLASAGYSDEQTQSIMQNLKDAAAFNRQGSMSMGDAVKSAAEGIKNENSVLVDNAGVTKNLSVIWDEYAESIGKTAANLTDTEKRLATTEGIMRETAFQTGDAAKYASTFAGAQAALKAQTKALSSALGSIFAPALQACTPPITALVSKLTLLAEKAGQVMSILFGTTSKASSSTAQLSNSTQKVSSNLDSATKKAKSYKKALLGIDEINLLGAPSSDSDTGGGSSSTTTVSSGNNLNSPLSDADKVIDPALATRADELRQKLESLEPVFIGVGTAAGAFLLIFEGAKLFMKIKKLGGLVETLKSLKLVSKLSAIAASVKGVFAAIGAALGVSAGWAAVIVAAIAAVIAGIVLLIVYWDEVKAASQKAWEWMKEKWSSLGEWFKDSVANPLKEASVKTWDGVKTSANDAWEGIKTVFSPVVNWFKDKFTQAWTAVKNVFNVGGKIFDGIKEGITEAFKAVVNAIISGINKVVTIPFNAINKTIDKLRNANMLGISPFAGLRDISIPQIPKLAAGAVIPPNREFIAMLGDQKSGTNIETPESLLRKIVREEGTRSGEGGDWHIYIVTPDGQVRGETIVTAIQRLNQKSGRTVIAVDT